jgi:hypothetical protein
VTPPSHINVLRTALGRVETVPFRRYVEVVMAAEWGPENPREALRAGAVAVKQYAWYYAMAGNWRGGSLGGRCFDVRDSTADQLYRPGSKVPARTHLAAVAASWGVTVRKASRGGFFPTQYNNGGDYRRCGTGLTGHTLRQIGATNCARAGYSFQRILRLYYGPGAALVTASRRSDPGDIGVLVARETSGPEEASRTDAIVLASDGKRIKARSDQTLGFSMGTLLGHVTGDLVGDKRADLAVLLTSDDGPRIDVFAGTEAGFGPATTSWEGGGLASELANARIELIGARWARGGRLEAGLVVQPRDGGRPSRVYELRSTDGAAVDPALVWEGEAGGALWTAFGGDFTGDRRADVALLVDAGDKGTRFVVLAGSGADGALTAPKAWATDDSVVRAETVPLAADINGDGRMDVVLVERKDATGLRFVAFRSNGHGFDRLVLGGADEGYPWGETILGTTDLNGDGLGDVYALVPDGSGAHVEAFLSRGRSVAHASWGSDAALELDGATAY